MEDTLGKLASLLTKDPSFLNGILKLADLLGTEYNDKEILARDIRCGTVNYYHWTRKLLSLWISANGKKTIANLTIVLRQMGLENAAETIDAEFAPTTILSFGIKRKLPNKLKKVWNVANPVSSFVGREDVLTQLSAFLHNGKKPILVLSGMGGQGKTQICRKWIQELKKDDNCPTIIWLPGESGQSLNSSIKKYVKEAKANPENETKPTTFEEDMQELLTVVENEDKILWVIDNVDKVYEEIETFAKLVTNGTDDSSILITSRIREVLAETAEYLMLPSLSIAEAEELIRDGVKGNVTKNDISNLCEEMGYHALALQLSVSFIRSKQTRTAIGIDFGITNFLKLFNQDKQAFLQGTEKLSDNDKNVLHHARMFMELLAERNDQASYLLAIVLSLTRHDGINFPFLINDLMCSLLPELRNCREKDGNTSFFEEAIDTLQSLCMIDANLPNVMMHQLIQESIRILYPGWWVIAETILINLDVSQINSGRAVQHVLPIWDLISEKDFLLRRHASKFGEVYKALHRASQIQSLLPVTESYRKTVTRLFGNSGSMEEIIEAEMYYGAALKDSGKWEESLLQDAVVEKMVSQLLKENHPFAPPIEYFPVNFLTKMIRDGEKSLEAYQKILSIFISVNGVNSKETVEFKAKIAGALSFFGHFKESLNLYDEVLAYIIDLYGPSHPETLATRHNIASVYFLKSDFERAEADFLNVLMTNAKLFGWKHIQTLQTREYLAKIYFRREDYSKAKWQLEGIIQDQKETLGPEHRKVFDNLSTHALCLLNLGDAEKAVLELEKVLEFEMRELGPKHPDVKKTRKFLETAIAALEH